MFCFVLDFIASMTSQMAQNDVCTLNKSVLEVSSTAAPHIATSTKVCLMSQDLFQVPVLSTELTSVIE